MKQFIFIFIMTVVVGGAGFGVFINTPNLNEDEIRIEVQRGDTISKLANQWQADGWLHSAWVTKAFASLFPINLRPGEYSVPPQLTSAQLLEFLNTAQPLTYKFQLIEGLPVSEALQQLEQQTKLEQDIQPLDSIAVNRLLGINGSLEGLLFPDTYIFSNNEPVSSLLRQSHQRLNDVLNEEWQQRAPGLPYTTPYEALIMASIVEKETGLASERQRIAGVFVRRLQKGMRLETDPTVIYGLGPDFNGNLTRAHLRDSNNTHNTYRHFGLPPTPIAMVGREAIHAALQPESGDELFFVAKGDGSHYFSATLAEHQRAVRKYQMRRSDNYRSAPK